MTSTLRSLYAGALLALACLGADGFAQSPASAGTTFRSDVNEVRVTFSTTDQGGHIISTMQAQDFAIVDRDMVIHDFRSFQLSDYKQLAVAVLVDASGSITPQFRQELANVVQIVSTTEDVPDPNFSVVSFRDLKPAVVCEGNCRALNANGQFPVIKSGGLTPLYDSIVFASRRLGQLRDPHIKKILILCSDGSDTISLRSFAEAIDSALRNDIAVYSVDISPRPHNAPGSTVLRNLSYNSGGRYFPLEAGAGKVLEAILEDLHAAYTVTYKLPSYATGFHQVRILPTHNVSLQFHCRQGYYYPSNPEE